MHDVARVASVGTMTVSRVLNRSAKVSEETAQRVYQAIEQLGYHPNEMARALRSLKSRTIGLIVPSIADPFFAVCAHAINTVAREHGYSVILTTSDEDPATEYAEAQSMLQRHVDGLLVIPADTRHSRISQEEFTGTHIVTFDRPAGDGRIDSVLVENQSGAKRAVQHLIEVHGHRHILFLGFNRSLFTVRSRFDGYRQAMEEAGLEAASSFDCNSTEATTEVLARRLSRKSSPTALFTANNIITRYTLRALIEIGVQVPEQVALIGFDDFELAEIMRPPLTAVRQPVSELGRVAANLLFERIQSDKLPEEGNHVILPIELVIRNSCGCHHT
jgi:LacI family transcriptional regulator